MVNQLQPIFLICGLSIELCLSQLVMSLGSVRIWIQLNPEGSCHFWANELWPGTLPYSSICKKGQ